MYERIVGNSNPRRHVLAISLYFYFLHRGACLASELDDDEHDDEHDKRRRRHSQQVAPDQNDTVYS